MERYNINMEQPQMWCHFELLEQCWKGESMKSSLNSGDLTLELEVRKCNHSILLGSIELYHSRKKADAISSFVTFWLNLWARCRRFNFM